MKYLLMARKRISAIEQSIARNNLLGLPTDKLVEAYIEVSEQIKRLYIKYGLRSARVVAQMERRNQEYY